jgi:predicted amidophosphoribosyltransferase
MAVIGAFRGEFPAGIAGKTIVIVDDIYTVILLLKKQ